MFISLIGVGELIDTLGRPKLIQILILSCNFIWPAWTEESCDYGWFGPHCDYKCRCESGLCSMSGDCGESDRCASDWFGPGCQFEDLVHKYGISHETWLKDANATTCNNKISDLTANVVFTHYFYVTWLRMVVTDRKINSTFEITFNKKNISCTNMRVYVVNRQTLDVTCDLTTNVNEMDVTGELVQHLCDLFVSGGRNLALRQEVMHNTYLTDPAFAVDNKWANYEHCAETAGNSSTWYITFRQNPTIYRVLIHNKLDLKAPLKTFRLLTRRISDMVIETYTEPGKEEPIYYVSLVKTNASVHQLIIEHDTKLALCEVETFGAVSCPDSKWGLDCTENCNCYKNQSCSEVTGQCAVGCPNGFYGFMCSYPCHTNCGNYSCSEKSGQCHGCKIGYYGSGCKVKCLGTCYNGECNFTSGECSVCESGFFGPLCLNKCSLNCLDKICDFQTGRCIRCKDKFFGVNCTQLCNSHCRDGKCSKSNGSCLRCERGYYKHNCAVPCPTGCHNNECSRLNGTCLSCDAGYYGNNCSSTCPAHCQDKLCDRENGLCSKDKTHISASLILPFTALLVCCALILAYAAKRKRTQQVNEEDRPRHSFATTSIRSASSSFSEETA